MTAQESPPAPAPDVASRLRATRDEATSLAERLLGDMEAVAAARDGGNMIEPMLQAVRAEATLGEICGVLREEWGSYTEPARF